MLADKSYLPDLVLTTTDERIIRKTERYQVGLARHYFAPSITLLLLIAASGVVITWRQILRWRAPGFCTKRDESRLILGRTGGGGL
jgi:hypothetical protein